MKTVKDRNYSFNHTKQRLLERYSIDITIADYDYLCTKVITNDHIALVMMEKQNNDIQYTYDLDFEYRSWSRNIRVVWSDTRQCITTVLERE